MGFQYRKTNTTEKQTPQKNKHQVYSNKSAFIISDGAYERREYLKTPHEGGIQIRFHFPVHLGGVHKWSCAVHHKHVLHNPGGTYGNGTSVYIWTYGIVEYRANENVTQLFYLQYMLLLNVR